MKTLGAHQLAPVRRRDAHYSSRRGPRCGLARGAARVLARRGWVGENSGLSEQPAGHADDVRDLRYDAISEVITEFVNTLLSVLTESQFDETMLMSENQ